MHELGITKSIFDVVEREARRQNIKKVSGITLALGEQYDYVPEIIQEYFNLFSEGTFADSAVISCKRIPGKDFYIESIEIEEDSD